MSLEVETVPRSGPGPPHTMTHTLEIDDDLWQRIQDHCEPEETPAEFLEELVSVYETEGAFLQEGYSE